MTDAPTPEISQEAAREMLAALHRCAIQFQFYTTEHRKKGTPEGDAKAATNAQFEALCRAAIALATGGEARS